MNSRSTHILSVDVEDWFHILENEGGPTRSDWPALESRVARNTERLLDMFQEADVKGTFFVVGWVAEREPRLVRRIAEAGHEIGSHSFWHEVMRRHSRTSLAMDLDRSRKLLQDLTGQAVHGFRAPGGSITQATAWVFDVIVEQGYRYDSSLCPGYSSHGGFASAFPAPHRVRCGAGTIDEIPASTFGAGRLRIPYGGGGYLRMLPYAGIRAAMALEARRGWPANIYVHPREIDADQPRMQLAWKRSFKYYVGLKRTETKLRSMLRDHLFQPAGAWLDEHRRVLEERILDVRSLTESTSPEPDPSLVPPPPEVRG